MIITKLILLSISFRIGLSYFTNVLQQCTCGGISSEEQDASPYCSEKYSKSCSSLKTKDLCVSNFPNMNCVWNNSTCTEFTSCSKLLVNNPVDCRKQLFGVCSYNSSSPMNQDSTLNCSDTLYQKCSTLTTDYLCVGAFETRYKICDWQKNKCVAIDTEKCSSFPNQQSCQFFDCIWEANKCREKKCLDIKASFECTKVKTEFSEGYDICEWDGESNTCGPLEDSNKLTINTCYTGSLYTYQWYKTRKECVKCTKTQNVVTSISQYFNATYCGLGYSNYTYSLCQPKIRESYTLTVIINILIIFQNGTYFYTDDVTIYLVELVTIIYENNTIMNPNGTYCYDNGTLLDNGEFTDHACVTDIDLYYYGFYNSLSVFTNYTEKVEPVDVSERIMVIFKSGTYIQVSKTILKKVYLSMHVTIIYKDNTYRQPSGDWCYPNYTLILANQTQIPNGCLTRPVEKAYIEYLDIDTDVYVSFPTSIPNPFIEITIIEIFIVMYTNGTKITASNIYIFQNVTIIFQNNTVILPDSTFCFTNGTRRYSDGSLVDGICPKSVDVYTYGYINDTKYYDFSGNEKNITEYKPPVVEETLDVTIIYQNGTYIYSQDVVEIEEYIDIDVTIIYPNDTVRYPNKTVCTNDGTIIQPDGTQYENACWQKKDTYYRGYYSSSGGYVLYEKQVPNPTNYQTTVIFSNGTKVYTTNVTIYQNVTIIYKNSTVVQPNGTIQYYNGTVKNTDGTTYYTNTYVDRTTYYQGYYDYSGTYVQYQPTYTYSYYYYGYSYYYYDYYDYDYSYYDPQDSYYSSSSSYSSSQSSSQNTTIIVNITEVNQNIDYQSNSKFVNSEIYTSYYCRCSQFQIDVCETVGYCKSQYGGCTEKDCSQFTTKQQCTQFELLSGCEWYNGQCQSYSGCTGKPVSQLSDCIKMGRYSCTISDYGDLMQASSSYNCKAQLKTTYCGQYSKYYCYDYVISQSERCVWIQGYCTPRTISCDYSLPRDVCQLFDCYYDINYAECRQKFCTDINDQNKCNIIIRSNNQHHLCLWQDGYCFNADNPQNLNQTQCAQATHGTYRYDGSSCSLCQQYRSVSQGFVLSLAILLLYLVL